MKHHRVSEQLLLPSSLDEAVTLREELARGHARITDLEAENQRQQEELRIAGRAYWQDLDEAYRRLDTWRKAYELLREHHQEQPAPPGAIERAWIERELTRLVAVTHPDKWAGSPAAEELTKQVLALRQRVQEGRV
jgi:hypothetical protein